LGIEPWAPRKIALTGPLRYEGGGHAATARWTKKYGKSHYGYKNHVNVDRKHKLVPAITPAMPRCMTARRSITC
jgi:hypothetical protein